MSEEPIYRQVMRDVEARAEVGKPKYGRYLMNDTNGRDPLQDAYEEQIDGAKYLKQAIHDRRALLEYVGRLEGALRQIESDLDEISNGKRDDVRNDLSAGESHGWEAAFLHVLPICRDALATSPLTDQPQPAHATDWRPIAEAPQKGFYVFGCRDADGWDTGRVMTTKERAIAIGYTHYHPLSAPPQEGE